MLLIAILFCLSTTVWSVSDELYDLFELPDVTVSKASVKTNYIQIRRSATAFLAPDASGRLSLQLDCKKKGNYDKPTQFAIKDLDGNDLIKGDH